MAYLAVMMAVAIIGLSAAYTVSAGASLAQHDAEEELLAIGLDFQRALQRYAAATPVGTPRAPTDLESLLKDPRQPGVQRYLRQIPVDPLTGQRDWVIVRNPQNLIVGLHSASARKPLKVTGFAPALSLLEGERETYEAWVFRGPVP
ncbi:type II secretion system protein [Ideonella sp. DXS29W]|uniref:Type II secretion system protein n=1 Tax=Ideonella lacteola TaxID=2984193 RepID=A0ABU9BNV0_9BURK